MTPDRWVDGHPDQATLVNWLAWRQTCFERGDSRLAHESMVFTHLAEGCGACLAFTLDMQGMVQEMLAKGFM